MPAPKGNTNAVKLKTEKLKKEAYEAYCKWIAKGKSFKSFTFEKDNLKVTGFTVKKYIEEDPVVFDPIHKDFAWAKGYAIWESVCEESAIGKNTRANTASLQMIMRNKYGWDKTEKLEETHKGHVIELAKSIRSESVAEAEACDTDSE